MGRPKGAKNKITREREARVQSEIAARELGTGYSRKKLAKERMEELMDVALGNVTHYQNRGWHMAQQADGTMKLANINPSYNEEAFRFWWGAAQRCSADLSQYQSPRLSAVAVGQVTKMEIVVKGGLPPRNTKAMPVQAPADVKLIDAPK
jgi:hypothetical protein